MTAEWRAGTAFDAAALLATAREMQEHAYVPYSGFRVGAALLTADGRVFTGANVENAAYSPTLCAERVALVDYGIELPAGQDMQATWTSSASSGDSRGGPCAAPGASRSPLPAASAELLPGALPVRSNQ